MKWSFAPMVDISEEDRENYPNGNGGFYEKKIDTDNATIYDKFVDGMVFINEEMKKYSEPKPTKLTLPKLKKVE